MDVLGKGGSTIGLGCVIGLFCSPAPVLVVEASLLPCAMLLRLFPVVCEFLLCWPSCCCDSGRCGYQSTSDASSR